MKLIECSAEEIREVNPLKKIEMAGRTCYKSEANITDDSSIRFVKNLYNNKHLAMLEHAVFTARTTYTDMLYNDIQSYKDSMNWFRFMTIEHDDETNSLIVTASLRAIVETYDKLMITAMMAKVIEDNYENIKELHLFPENKFTGSDTHDIELITDKSNLSNCHRFRTFRLITDRGVTHEIVRHRVASYAQESTRYVNYSKSDDMLFIKPYDFDNWSGAMKALFMNNCEDSERAYLRMIRYDATPQQARAVLSNAIKTEIVVTASEQEWEHIFNLRLRGTTGKPHPDMKMLMKKVYEIYQKD